MNRDYKPIKGYEDRYAINIYGEVITLSNKRHRKPQLINGGYYQLALYKNRKVKFYLIHRLVYETFKGEIPEGLEINHIDGNKSNNHLSNLEMVTAHENMLHAVHVLGRHRGENSHRSKLTKDDIPNIRELAKVKSLVSIAKLYNVSDTTINYIVNNKTWTHIK